MTFLIELQFKAIRLKSLDYDQILKPGSQVIYIVISKLNNWQLNQSMHSIIYFASNKGKTFKLRAKCHAASLP